MLLLDLQKKTYYFKKVNNLIYRAEGTSSVIMIYIGDRRVKLKFTLPAHSDSSKYIYR